jgi:hypothetical protein
MHVVNIDMYTIPSASPFRYPLSKIRCYLNKNKMVPSQNEQNGQEEEEKEEHNDDGENNVLTNEIDSWNNLVCFEGGRQIPL